MTFWEAYKLATPANELGFYTPLQPVQMNKKENTMEGDLVIKHLGAAESSLIKRCIAAVEKEDVSGIDKQSFYVAMESAVVALRKDHPDLSEAKSWERLLSSPTGAALYSGYTAPRD
jgi:hypothetical protein